jgi:ribosomal protein S2
MPSSISRIPEKITLVGFTTIQFFDYGAYLGYSDTSWDYRIRSFISHRKYGSYIFNLNKTIVMLKNALSFFLRVAVKRGYCALVNEKLISFDVLLLFLKS